jgi:hypothetical protein
MSAELVRGVLIQAVSGEDYWYPECRFAAASDPQSFAIYDQATWDEGLGWTSAKALHPYASTVCIRNIERPRNIEDWGDQ